MVDLLIFGFGWYEDRIGIQQLNRFPRCATRHVRVVPHHAGAHVANERLNDTDGSPKLNHARDKRVPQA